MLRVTVQLIPRGDETKTRTLATLEIANDGTGDENTGNYRGRLLAEYGRRDGVVRGFRRKTQSVWTLVGTFLKQWGHTKASVEVTPPPQMSLNLTGEND